METDISTLRVQSRTREHNKVTLGNLTFRKHVNEYTYTVIQIHMSSNKHIYSML